MSKKIIAVAILMIAIIVVFAACKKDEYDVSYTVPVENGETIEVYKDEEGNEFVTNVDGDKVPVTTDKDGFYDDINALVTETTVPTTEASKDSVETTTVSSDKGTTTTKPVEDESTMSGNDATENGKDETTTKSDNETTTDKTTDSDETTTGNTIIIGGEVEQEDSISWQEIKDAAKKANKS